MVLSLVDVAGLALGGFGTGYLLAAANDPKKSQRETKDESNEKKDS